MARRWTPMLTLPPLLLLGGCNMVVLDPAGDIARQQGGLVMISTGLMLLIVLPVMALIALFAWRYRAQNRDATYTPDWDHSTQLELVIWAAPLMIIICLGALTWVGTHLLDPYRPLNRIAHGQQVPANTRPLEVQVVALDWKWLFIYPEQGIATVNEFAAPMGRPVHFSISSSSVMNSFYIPALAGQIYAMPGMETTLHAVFNNPGTFDGFSANYSGAGFSSMRFKAKSLTDAQFAQWVDAAKAGNGKLDRAAYLKLEQPSEKVPVQRFASVDADLFDAVVNLCVEPGKMCMRDMMSIDAKGGLGMAGIHNVQKLSYDKFAARGTMPGSGAGTMAATGTPSLDRKMVAALCAPKTPHKVGIAAAAPVDLRPLTGAGLTPPGRAATPLSVAWANANSDTPARPKS
ncbi:MAG TPA: ubiquinol oxidase subunit II [Sphingobium sp.]|uniref:ubiquinol oxidase subunit II n=1 Tax=Sphingobium sp. TaxID=1912891 RepID=UPI002ED59CCE